MLMKQPAAGGESCKAGFFLVDGRRFLVYTVIIGYFGDYLYDRRFL